jgi:hypothetical protein
VRADLCHASGSDLLDPFGDCLFVPDDCDVRGFGCPFSVQHGSVGGQCSVDRVDLGGGSAGFGRVVGDADRQGGDDLRVPARVFGSGVQCRDDVAASVRGPVIQVIVPAVRRPAIRSICGPRAAR